MLELRPLTDLKSSQVVIPGSKSYTNRALIIAALTEGPVLVRQPLESEDVDAMTGCLNSLGIKTEQTDEGINVSGSIRDVLDGEYTLDVDISGTTARFITALAITVPGTKVMGGKPGLNNRPIGELVEGLRGLGANIEYLGKEGFPPLKINPAVIQPGSSTRLRGDISSQYFSAILMVGPSLGGLNIEVLGNQVSKPYIDMSTDLMAQFGVDRVHNLAYQRYIVESGQDYQARDYTVEGDVSSASYFLAIAALCQRSLTLLNLNPNSKQADMKMIQILEQMGSKFSYGPNSISIEGHGVSPIDFDMEDCPDQVQTVGVLAAFGEGLTRLSGTTTLELKETKRLTALTTELAKIGITTRTDPDKRWVEIDGGAPRAALIDTYGDHRMAMSFAVAGTRLAGMQINNPEVVAKTFPDFWTRLQEIGVDFLVSPD